MPVVVKTGNIEAADACAISLMYKCFFPISLTQLGKNTSRRPKNLKFWCQNREKYCLCKFQTGKPKKPPPKIFFLSMTGFWRTKYFYNGYFPKPSGFPENLFEKIWGFRDSNRQTQENFPEKIIICFYYWFFGKENILLSTIL